MKIPFSGRVLVLGCGAVSRCLLPLLLRRFEMDFTKLTVLDFVDARPAITDILAAGAAFVQQRMTPANLFGELGTYLGAGDLLIDLAWNIGCDQLLEWCHDHHVLYINTSIELWDPYTGLEDKPPTERTLYVRHMALRKLVSRWREPGTTAVVEHGANPGLVSHWTKVGLEDIARTMLSTLKLAQRQRTRLEKALADGDYARLAMLTGVKVIHISERDTQISGLPKRLDEFVNTWSVEGLREEGTAPAEMGWGTHERRLPPGACRHISGPGNQICLAQMGINTFVRSWVPLGGEIIGMIIRHGEAFTISDALTVWEDDTPLYRPTVHYAYQPADGTIASLNEFRARNYQLQTTQRIFEDEIIEGRDEIGVLLLGHALNGWWVGSQLEIDEARRHVPHQNATTLQVAASLLGALAWMIRNPHKGLVIPDQMPHREILEVANPYLGTCPSVQTDWTPLKNRYDPFEKFGQRRPSEDNLWQFETFTR